MTSGLQQLHIDIMCQWAAWSERVVEALQRYQPPTSTQQQQPLHQQEELQQLQQRIQELRDLVCTGSWGAVRKALSHAHGTLHSQACQMLWQPGWTSGCAKTLGEECEQLFSYLSRFSGTTRNQSSAGGWAAHLCSIPRSGCHIIRFLLGASCPGLAVYKCCPMGLLLHHI
jgi:hypothetical protein